MMKQNKFLKLLPISILLLLLPLVVSLESCSSSSSTSILGNWINSTPFKGSRRSGSVVFTIGNSAFVGLGYNGNDYFTDFYQFDLTLGYWQTRAPFPGVPRERAVAFSIGTKGYVGLGYNRDQPTVQLGDFWEYNSATNTWKQLNNFGGTARYNAIGFAIGETGYVGTGNDGLNYNGDFWQYTPSTDTWTEIVSYPGQKREEGLAFIINGEAYVTTGRNNGLTDTNFWKFSPTTKTWTNLTPLSTESYYNIFTAAVRRYDAVAFVTGGKAYIGTGINASGSTEAKLYQYDPMTQIWTEETAFEGSTRSQAVSFVLNDRVYVGTGQSGSTRFDDIWEFRYDQAYNAND